ncbi:hypothetical protein [Streptomyces sp. NPDC000983]|uniref:hypothetical protein n=1 Tax=Streptomyces sp. NPDC000983 TaxID=3154373 RepID=UPI0033340C11
MRGLTTLAGGHVIEGFKDLLKLVTLVTTIAVGMVFGAALASRDDDHNTQPARPPAPPPDPPRPG